MDVGSAEGDGVGIDEGSEVGFEVGTYVGEIVGFAVGFPLGLADGRADGRALGLPLGRELGRPDGIFVGRLLGQIVGEPKQYMWSGTTSSLKTSPHPITSAYTYRFGLHEVDGVLISQHSPEITNPSQATLICANDALHPAASL